MPNQLFRACEVLQPWRSVLPAHDTADDANFHKFDKDFVSKGGDAYRQVSWKADLSDPCSGSVETYQMRFQHYKCGPRYDDHAGTDTHNLNALEVPDNWQYLASHYLFGRVEAAKVEQTLLVDKSSPACFIAEWWSNEPYSGNKDYASMKEIPGIRFRFVNGQIPHQMNTDDADSNGQAKAGYATNPSYVGTTTGGLPTSGSYMQTGMLPQVVRLKSFRRMGSYWKGSDADRPYLPLTDVESGTLQGFSPSSYTVPTFSYSDIGQDVLEQMGCFYHFQMGVMDPTMSWPPIKVRAQMKITYYTSFKDNVFKVGAVKNSGKIPGLCITARGPSLQMHLNALTEDPEDKHHDHDNPTTEDSRYLALDTRKKLSGHVNDFRANPYASALSSLYGDAQHDGGHPWILKRVGTYNVAGGGGVDYWTNSGTDETEMADGKNLPNDSTQLSDAVTTHPVLIDIRHDAAGNLPYLPEGMTVSELRSYLLDADA